RNVGEAYDGGEVADLQLRQAALPQEQVGDRTDRIRLVVAAENGDGRQRQRPPAQGRSGQADFITRADDSLTHRKRAPWRASSFCTAAMLSVANGSSRCIEMAAATPAPWPPTA